MERATTILDFDFPFFSFTQTQFQFLKKKPNLFLFVFENKLTVSCAICQQQSLSMHLLRITTTLISKRGPCHQNLSKSRVD
jgi:hypothetical protein